MNGLSNFIEQDVRAASVMRGEVIAVCADGSLSVVTDEDAQELRCDLLQSGGPALQLTRGDEVLIWVPAAGVGRGVVLGRIGADRSPPRQEKVPEELVIEAKQELTFKCGEGSITLRADGKVLIKGKDLVSHAQRTNRIKGGSVAIN